MVHAQGLVPKLGEPLTAHPLRPLEPVLAHEGGAAPLGPFAHRAAGRKGLTVVWQADGGVHAAQEEEEVWGAADADQRPELVHLQSHFLLGVMVELIRHVSQVVANALTHGDGNGLTHQVLGGSQRRFKTLDEQQQQLLQKTQPEQHESHCRSREGALKNQSLSVGNPCKSLPRLFGFGHSFIVFQKQKTKKQLLFSFSIVNPVSPELNNCCQSFTRAPAIITEKVHIRQSRSNKFNDLVTFLPASQGALCARKDDMVAATCAKKE